MTRIKRSNIMYLAIAAMLLNIFSLSLCVSAGAEELIPTVVINGQTLDTDVDPIIDSGRILVPIRAICEAMGAEVEWQGDENTVSAVRNGSRVSFVLGQTEAFKDGESIEMDVVPRVEDETVLVPLRFISQALGAEVDWNEDTSEAIINFDDEDTGPAAEAEAEIYDQAEIYGPDSGKVILNANARITADGATLRNMIINGDLIVDADVGDGSVTLEGLHVEGTTYVYGGGADSVTFDNCRLENMIADKEDVAIVLGGSTTVKIVKIINNTFLKVDNDGSGPGQVIVNGGVAYLEGAFDLVTIEGTDTYVKLSLASVQNMMVKADAGGTTIRNSLGSSIYNLTLDGQCYIKGIGTIYTATVNASDCYFNAEPEDLIINKDGSAEVLPSITISDIETTSIYGGFRFTTSESVASSELDGKISLDSIVVHSVEPTDDGYGKEWEAVVPGIIGDQSYNISFKPPFDVDGPVSLAWDPKAPAVQDLEAYGDDDNEGVEVYFDAAPGQEDKIKEYKIYVVKLSTSPISVQEATYLWSCETVEMDSSDEYELTISADQCDSDGEEILPGHVYVLYVISMADGVGSVANGIAGPSTPFYFD